jgi:hypothetical protein
MKRKIIFSTVIFFLAVNTLAQSRRTYNHFHIEFNKGGKAVAVFFQESDATGCSGITYANGTIKRVEWDIVVTKFTAQLNTGRLTFFVPDDLNEISNADRGLLTEIFRKGNRVKIAWRTCGSGNIPNLISVKVL